MKCEFCGTETKILKEGPNGIGLCVACELSLEKRLMEEEKMEGKIIEMPLNETVEEEIDTKEVVETPRCEIVIGVTKDGQIYFNVGGTEADLLTIDGLVKYAEKRMEYIWAAREAQIAQAAAQSEENSQ